MSVARIIDGVALASEERTRIKARVEALRARGREVRLDAVLIEAGDNGARVYADNQAKTCEALGITYRLHRVTPTSATHAYDEIAGRVLLLANDPTVTAMMMHLPLPEGVDVHRIQALIAATKDVEGVNPANIGNIVYGRSSLAPCTALAVMRMLERVWVEKTAAGLLSPGQSPFEAGKPFLRGQVAVVVGAGDVVGKPIAVLLMRQEATVISCNKWTPSLAAVARTADVLIAAAGVPGLIRRDMVKPDAIVIDVGVNRVKGEDGKTRTTGDVAFEEASQVAGWISPVPGGVGPVTVSMLLHNVVQAAEAAGG
ncbi:MAG: bifunctional 5,10-methylenetetrahydrofolate dehydrogenase/5,10-methenyltetrahydrofolate cyclohydrolase [Phycisphaerae bacterium]